MRRRPRARRNHARSSTRHDASARERKGSNLMSAIMVSQANITNRALFDEYMSKTQNVAARFGAEVVTGGRFSNGALVDLRESGWVQVMCVATGVRPTYAGKTSPSSMSIANAVTHSSAAAAFAWLSPRSHASRTGAPRATNPSRAPSVESTTAVRQSHPGVGRVKAQIHRGSSPASAMRPASEVSSVRMRLTGGLPQARADAAAAC